MQKIKSFVLPESMIKILDAKWHGTYTVYELDAVEYLRIMSEATNYWINQLKLEKKQFDGIVPEEITNVFMVCKSCKLNDKPIDPAINIPPAKLYEALSLSTLPHNTLSKEEYNALFLSSSKNETAH